MYNITFDHKMLNNNHLLIDFNFYLCHLYTLSHIARSLFRGLHKIMKKAILPSLFFSLSFIACTMHSTKKDNNEPSQSFLPMQIGNYWKINAQNYTEIQDTLRINGKLYFKFYSLVGGDAVSTSYLRIDQNNQLLESWPDSSGEEYLRAKFNGKVNDSFFTLNDQTVNDNKVTIVSKSDKKITFSYDMVYQPNLKGHPNTISYIKGQGLEDNWNNIKINGVIIK